MNEREKRTRALIQLAESAFPMAQILVPAMGPRENQVIKCLVKTCALGDVEGHRSFEILAEVVPPYAALSVTGDTPSRYEVTVENYEDAVGWFSWVRGELVNGDDIDTYPHQMLSMPHLVRLCWKAHPGKKPREMGRFQFTLDQAHWNAPKRQQGIRFYIPRPGDIEHPMVSATFPDGSDASNAIDTMKIEEEARSCLIVLDHEVKVPKPVRTVNLGLSTLRKIGEELEIRLSMSPGLTLTGLIAHPSVVGQIRRMFQNVSLSRLVPNFIDLSQKIPAQSNPALPTDLICMMLSDGTVLLHVIGHRGHALQSPQDR